MPVRIKFRFTFLYTYTSRDAKPPANDESRMSEGCDFVEACDPFTRRANASRPTARRRLRIVIRHSDFVIRPLRKCRRSQALATAATAGVPPDFARMIYADWSARGGRDGAGVLVPWARYLAKRWAREGPEWQAGTHRLQTKNRSSLNSPNHGNSAKYQPPAGKSEYDRDRDRTGIQSTAGEALRCL